MGETLDSIRAKYSQYDDLPDAELADLVLTKYPVYHDTDLVKDAMPVRAKKYGEIREAPSIVQTFVKDITGGLGQIGRAVAGSFGAEGQSGLGPVASGAATAVGAPFKAVGSGVERVAAHTLPESVQDRRGYDLPGRLGGAAEVLSGLGGVAGIRAVPKLLERGAGSVPKAAVAPVRAAVAPSAPQQLELPLSSTRLGPAGVVKPKKGTQTELPLTQGPQHAPYEFTTRPGLKAGPVEDAVRAEVASGTRPSMWRRALTGITGKDAQEFKFRMKARAGDLWLPEDVAKGNPAAEGIVRDAYAAHDIQRQLAKDIEDQLSPLYKSVKNDPKAITRIHRALDGQPGSLSPTETQAAVGLRQLFDNMADMAGLPHEQRLADYFPHLRDEISSVLKVKIETGGKPVGRAIPQEYKVFFQKPRTVEGSEQIDFGVSAVQQYVQAMAKRVAMKGGTLPDGSKVEGMLNRVGPKFDQLPEINEFRAYFRDYVGDMVHGGARSPNRLLSPQMASTIKKVEFLRTIGYNVMSPVHNLTQTLNTFAKTSPQSWSAAWYDIFKNPKVNALARKHLDLQISKADIEILANPNKLDRALDHIISGKGKAGWMFQKAEETNRLHAFAAGYRDALKQGLKGDDAVQYAKRIVDETQFRFGPENTPALLRRSELAGVVGQYKKFQLGQSFFLKNLLLHDPKGFAKWLTGTVALGGTELPGIKQVKDVLVETLGGDPNDIKFRGALGESGIYIGNQVGLGSLPIESLRDLAFALPGPAISHILETASVMSNKALGITDMAAGRFGEMLSPDEWASRLVRLGSVQANRIRQALVEARTEGANLRAARNVPESFGLAAPSGKATRPKPGVPQTGIGIRTQKAQEYSEAQTNVYEKSTRWRDLTTKFNEARAAGDHEAMESLNAEAMDEFNRPLHGSKAGAKGARQRQRTPGLERQLGAAPKAIRRDLKKEVQP